PLLGLRSTVPLRGASAPVPLEVFGLAGDVLTNVRRIDRILLASALGLIAALTLLLTVQMRAAMAPLRRLTTAIAAQRETGGSSDGGDSSNTPTLPPAALDELPLGSDLAPLCSELGALLSHNASVVERARTHAADLNHALKKPLALLAAAASSQQQLPASEVLQQVDEMTRLIDRYQARTLGDSVRARPTTRAVPVAECLEQLLRVMRKLHATQELVWQLALPDDALRWRWRGERTDLEEALGNLLDNAGKWAASRVLVSACFTPPEPVRRGQRQRGGQLAISIEDDGPGMSTEQLAAAGQRGLRFDEHVHGSGLGLAIAGQIAAAWSAELHLDKSSLLKGLRATLTLPNVWQSAP
ncbi:MAG: sensor histidine kinase, partial [Ottowia sp.]|nr:sensor histidine kinase [Ottowia sp.]